MGLAQAQGLEVSASTIHRHSQRAVLVRPSTKRRRPRHRPGLARDSPDQTNFPGYSSFWDTVNYNPAFQGRQMRPNSLKFPVFI